MGWTGYEFRFSILVDSHGGERERIGEMLEQEFREELALLLSKPKYNQDLYIQII
jgi:hypothetical protein